MTHISAGSATLLPCPFCGAGQDIDQDIADTGVFWVRCSECCAEGAVADTREEAALRWNTRASLQPVTVTSPDVAARAPAQATPEMMKAAYAAYETEDIIAYADDWLEAVVNAALGVAQAARAEESYPDAPMVCAELYQVIGYLAYHYGIMEHPDVQKALDNASQHKLVHADLLPWPKQDLPALAQRSGDYAELYRQALRLLGAEDARQSKLHVLLETIREQIRTGVEPENRPDGLFKNIQDAVYAMRGRTPLLADAALVGALDALTMTSTDRACTCDPSERPEPCQKKYAFSECLRASVLAMTRPEGNSK